RCLYLDCQLQLGPQTVVRYFQAQGARVSDTKRHFGQLIGQRIQCIPVGGSITRRDDIDDDCFSGTEGVGLRAAGQKLLTLRHVVAIRRKAPRLAFEYQVDTRRYLMQQDIRRGSLSAPAVSQERLLKGSAGREPSTERTKSKAGFSVRSLLLTVLTSNWRAKDQPNTGIQLKDRIGDQVVKTFSQPVWHLPLPPA